MDRSRWHKPRVAVVIAHFDYSDRLEDAIVSVVDQSYDKIECVVVDDASSPAHRSQAEAITKKYRKYGIRYLALNENIGQIPAFYAGLDKTSAEFVCLLDPDDRYAKTFIETSVYSHLNNKVYAPLTTTDQYTFKNGQLLDGTFAHSSKIASHSPALEITSNNGSIRYFSADWVGWYWTSTSSLMFRRGVLALLRPIKKLSYRVSADAYLGNGAHMLGGTLFIEAPLVYRQLHDSNHWLAKVRISADQKDYNADAEHNNEVCKRDVAAAFLENGACDLFEKRFLSALLYRHFDGGSLALLRQESHLARELAPPGLREWRSMPLRRLLKRRQRPHKIAG